MTYRVGFAKEVTGAPKEGRVEAAFLQRLDGARDVPIASPCPDALDPRRLTMLIHILVLNYNGRSLLAQCLPTVTSAVTSRAVAVKSR